MKNSPDTNGGSEMMAIVKVADNLEFIGIMTEALCVKSNKTVQQVYYDESRPLMNPQKMPLLITIWKPFSPTSHRISKFSVRTQFQPPAILFPRLLIPGAWIFLVHL